jgi:hypothetical protein
VSFYDEVLRELMVALGAALLLGNLWALFRRRADARLVASRTVARVRPGSPVRGNRLARDGDESHDLPQAPVMRSVTYALIGLVVMVWGIASIASA